jgi:NADH-quinone oxidoreductase subunit F
MERNMERPLTENLKSDGQPLSIREYELSCGYQGLRKALTQMTPEGIIREVTASNLRGRGGAGFPTGQKWSAVPSKEGAHPRYFISNSDEMEPGAFKDRLLMEGNPHQLIEGMIIGSYATGADRAYIFLRWEYGESAKRLKKAIAEAYEAGYLGKDIIKSGYSLDMYLHVSAGRYICGEETALLGALEGRRAIPRAKPPFPQVSGLWGRPAVVNNAETLANVPHIIRNGAEWYKGLSRSADGGTKIYGVSGRVKRPGAWELPMGITIRELMEEHAGGMKDGFRLRGLLPGGGSTDFLLEDHLDTKMDFDSLQKEGSRLGTGTAIVLDDKTCPVGMVANLERFFARESCGWCTPCREGLPWVAEILTDIESGRGCEEDIGLLEEQAELLGPGRTFCAHAPGAVEPLQSALKYFREDFTQHIKEGNCPFRHTK